MSSQVLSDHCRGVAVGYSLGIDVGTSFVAAAIADGGPEVVPLADDMAAAPAAVGMGDDGGLLTGAAAAAQGARRPDLVVRGIRRMLGTAEQVDFGGRAHNVSDLLGALLEDVLARVSDRRGAQPDAVALSYPATWDAGRRQLFEQVAQAAGIRQPVWTTEPAAAATCYASGKQLNPGDVLAVYDLGGSNFDATVLRRTEAGFETIGTPEQVDGVAGSRFDDLVLGRVNDLSYGALDDLEMRDPAAIAALERLRRDCARAKEALSSDTEATISVALPNQRSEVQLTRGELEMLIQAPIESTIDTLDHALHAAGVTSGSLSGLLLVGGSSHIPLVGHRIAEAFGRPTVVGSDPGSAVALGAALLAQERAGRMPAAVPVGAVASPPVAPLPVAAPAAAPPVQPATEPEPAEVPRREQIPEPAQMHAPNFVRDESPAAPPAPAPAPAPAPEPAPAQGHGPVVVPTAPRRAQRVTVVPARGGRTGPVAAPSGGDVAHLPFAPEAPPTPSGPAATPMRAAEQPRPAGFVPGGPGPAPTSAPPPRAAEPWGPTTAPPVGGSAAPPAGAFSSGPAQGAPFQPGGPPPGAPPSGAPRGFGGGPGSWAPPRRPEPGGFPSPVPPPPPAGRGSWQLPVIIGLVVVLVAAAGFGGYLLLRPSHGPKTTGASGASTSAHKSASASASSAASPSVAAAVPIPSLGQPVDVGKTPNFVVAAPNGRQLYIASTDAGVVTVVDTAVNKVTATIPISAGPPQFLAFSPGGKKIYVSVWNTQRTIAAVVVVDTTTNAPVATIPVKTRPFLAAVSPDGKKVYVPNHDTGTISVIDATTNKSVGDFPVPANPHSVAFTADGTKIYAADHESNVVSVVDTATNKVITTIPVPKSPHNVALHRTRPLAMVCSYDANSVEAIDTTTNTVTATIPVGVNPQHIAYSADGRFAYVSNDGSNTVSVINLDTMAVTATIPTGPAPTSMAVLPDGRTGYISDVEGGTLTLLNLAG